MFTELGYDATTFQEIAARAELTRPAINHYFASKQVLYEAVMDQARAIVGRAVAEADGQTTLPAQLSAFLLAAVRPGSPDAWAAAFVVSAMLEAQRRPDLYALVADLQAGTEVFLTGAINAAIERGEISTEVGTAELVQLIVAMLWGVGFYGAFVGNPEGAAAIATHLEALLGNRLWKIN